MTDLEQEQEHRHPTVGQYVEIGVILAVVTGVEVALFFADVATSVTVPALLALTAIKFTLVVLWFMHLRYDHRLLSRVFATGVVLAILVGAALVALML